MSEKQHDIQKMYTRVLDAYSKTIALYKPMDESDNSKKVYTKAFNEYLRIGEEYIVALRLSQSRQAN